MVLSMTGFGKATCEVGTKKLTIEIKSLNSKQLDLFSRLPNIYREKELELRNYVAQKLERGKVEFSISMDSINGSQPNQINKTLVKSYYEEIKSLSQELGVEPPADWMRILLKMPEVMKMEVAELEETDWNIIRKAFEEAVGALMEFRQKEGESLKNVFLQKNLLAGGFTLIVPDVSPEIGVKPKKEELSSSFLSVIVFFVYFFFDYINNSNTYNFTFRITCNITIITTITIS